MLQQRSYIQAGSDVERSGSLFLVPTPIGNLEDMTFRAIKVLSEVSIILAEDTRHSIKLLNHFDIQKPLKSFHQHSHANEVKYWVTRLQAGEDIALISDAGMPLLNDPGHPLVQAALAENLNVIALPGANAALTALVASGLATEQFTYYGFFPRGKKEQIAILDLVGNRSETAIFYESPFRLKDAVKLIRHHLGEDCRLVIGRELTKRYEEYLRGSAGEISEWLSNHDIKGECVLLVAGGQLVQSEVEEIPTMSYRKQVEELIATGLNSKEAIKEVARVRKVKKQIVYAAYHEFD